jgi:hypothetical protein
MQHTTFDRLTRRLGSPISRRSLLRRGGAAGVVAVLLGSQLGTAARATDNRPQAVNLANAYIDQCIAGGGEPDVEVVEGAVEVLCFNAERERADYCSFGFDGTVDCGTIPTLLRQPAQLDNLVDGVFTSVLDGNGGGKASTDGSGATPGAPVPSSTHRKRRKGRKRHR